MISARVECEPTNPHDPMACKVVTASGVHIGSLSRERAAKFHNAIKKVGGAVTCHAVLDLWTPDDGRDEQVTVRIDLCDPWKIPGVKSVKPPRRPSDVGESGADSDLRDNTIASSDQEID